MATSNRIKASKSAPKKHPQSPLSTAGILEEKLEDQEEIVDVNKIPIDKNSETLVLETTESTNIKTEIKETPKSEQKKDELAVEHVNAEIVHKQDDIFDLFNIKKKEKIRKGQKNLVLKETNIEFLENLAHDTGRDQGEIVDTLLENLAKMMDINK